MYLALMTLVEAGDEVLIPNPGFVAYPTITRMAGGVSTFYQLPAASDFSFDLDDFKLHLNSKTKVVVCTSPSNPTGRTLTSDELRAMAAGRRGERLGRFYHFSDEIYRDLYYTGERPVRSPILSAHDCDQRTFEIDLHDRLASRLDSWRRKRHSCCSSAAWLCHHLRFNNFAEGGTGSRGATKRSKRGGRFARHFSNGAIIC